MLKKLSGLDLLLLALLFGFVGCSRNAEEVQPKTKTEEGKITNSVVQTKTAKSQSKLQPSTSNLQSDSDSDGFTESDRRVADSLEAALESEDLKQLKAALPLALKSSNPEIRNKAVDAIAWFEWAAIDELVPFMVDANRDVAENAVNCWVGALSSIEDEGARCSLIAGVMKVLTDREFQDTVVMELNNCDEQLSVRTLVNLIGGKNETASAAAKEQYEFTTGEKFSSVAEAEKWLREQRQN